MWCALARKPEQRASWAVLCRHRQGAPEHQAVAKRRDFAFGVDELDEPRAVGDFAVENCADKASIAQDELLVLAAAGVAQRDFLVAIVARLKHAGGKHVDPRDLQARVRRRRHVRLLRAAGQSARANARLFPQRPDEAESLASMLDAFADGENAGLARRHEV